MGRVKKYHSKEEKQIAKKRQWVEYYERNRDKINKKRIEAYYDRKNNRNI
jgi:hypothetical protein